MQKADLNIDINFLFLKVTSTIRFIYAIYFLILEFFIVKRIMISINSFLSIYSY